jgi:hypothetical protein
MAGRAEESEHSKFGMEFENKGDSGMCEDTSSGGDVKGSEDENAWYDADSGSGTMFVHENATCEGAEGKENPCLGSGMTLVHEAAGIIRRTGDVEGSKDKHMCSDIDSGSGSTAEHEDADDREGGEVGIMEGTDAGSGSDSGTTFVHKDASEVVGGLENKVNRVIEFGGVCHRRVYLFCFSVLKSLSLDMIRWLVT